MYFSKKYHPMSCNWILKYLGGKKYLYKLLKRNHRFFRKNKINELHSRIKKAEGFHWRIIEWFNCTNFWKGTIILKTRCYSSWIPTLNFIKKYWRKHGNEIETNNQNWRWMKFAKISRFIDK